MKVDKYEIKIDKNEILICCLKDKEKYVACIRKSKQASNDDCKLKIVRRVIKVKEEAWLKFYINMNSKLRKKVKNDLEKVSLNSWTIQYSVKPWKMFRSIDVLS